MPSSSIKFYESKIQPQKATQWLSRVVELNRMVEVQRTPANWTDGYVHYLDCGDGFMEVWICQNLSSFIL